MSKVVVEGHRKDKLKHIDPTTIIIGKRFREDLDIEDLVESIKEKGIIQPVTIDTNNLLLAGGRRTAAALFLQLPTIPVIIREASDELDLREIELMENVERKDFNWQDKAKLTAAIDKLRKEKDPHKWSQAKTAELLNKAPAQVSRDIQLAKAITAIPEIGECKTADDALKLLKKLEENAITTELRRRQADNMAKPVEGTGGIDKGVAAALRMADKSYVIKDCFTGMEALQSNGSFTIIECDPPYGIDLNEQKAGKESVGSTVTGYKEVERSEYPDFLDRLTRELFRVAGKDCWLIFWYGPTWHQQVLDSLRRAGWGVDEIPGIWVKPNGQTLQPELYFARCYEPFFLCRKGKPVMAERGRSNVLQFAGAKDKYHPTQRPVELIEELFDRLGAGTQSVLIPFLGSGATLRACFNKGFKGLGFDLDGKYKDKFMLAVEEDTRKLFKD